jgi:hypothetical protein
MECLVRIICGSTGLLQSDHAPVEPGQLIIYHAAVFTVDSGKKPGKISSLGSFIKEMGSSNQGRTAGEELVQCVK